MSDAYTPEAIASIIEQMKKQERVTISSIDDREDAVVIYGSIAVADSMPMSGVISYLPKSKRQEVSSVSKKNLITAQVQVPEFGTTDHIVEDQERCSIQTVKCGDCGTVLIQYAVMHGDIATLREPMVMCCGKLRRLQ